MAIRIDERFVIHAPVASVWDHLVDPRCVVACVPGGELDEVVDERTFHGRVRVRIGSLGMAFRGRVQLAEVDAERRRVVIVGQALDRTGAGSARLTLHSQLATLPDGATEVNAQVQVDVSGPLVQLGRGFLEQVGHELFRQFSGRVRDAVEAEEGERAAHAAGPPLRALPVVFRALRAWLATWVRPRAR